MDPFTAATEALTTFVRIIDRQWTKKQQGRAEAAKTTIRVLGLLSRFQDLLNNSERIDLSHSAVDDVKAEWPSIREEIFGIRLTHPSHEVRILADEVVKATEASFSAAYKFIEHGEPSTRVLRELKRLEELARGASRRRGVEYKVKTLALIFYKDHSFRKILNDWIDLKSAHKTAEEAALKLSDAVQKD